MVGNSAEEGLMQQIDNPSHTDLGRIVVPAALISGVLIYLFAGRYLPVLAIGGRLVLGFLTTAAVSVLLHRWLLARRTARFAAEMEAGRARRADESARQILGMTDHGQEP